LLTDIQAAYSDEDLNALRAKVTPEMLSYFSDQLAENASRGLVNKVTGVKLEQGDLAEAWNEGNVEYATVAMRFRSTTRWWIVQLVVPLKVNPWRGDRTLTFIRARNGGWLLSGLQQT
jgi:hypothetical protein